MTTASTARDSASPSAPNEALGLEKLEAAADHDPFAGIEDDAEQSPADSLRDALARVRREYVPIRGTFVQRASDAPDPGDGRPSKRASVLWELVRGRQEIALDLFLLLHALQPILSGEPLPLRVYARYLSAISRGAPVSPASVVRALTALESRRLIARHRVPRSPDPVITLLREDGSGAEWTRQGSPEAAGDEDKRYFALPFNYWLDGDAAKLSLPGKAMLLVILKETQDPNGRHAFKMAVERAPQFYGFSERTAERGYLELKKASLMREKVQKIADPRHPAGRRSVYWRALESPYSTNNRAVLQDRARKAIAAAP